VDESATHLKSEKIPNRRWGIALLLGCGVRVNYFDRVNLAISQQAMGSSLELKPRPSRPGSGMAKAPPLHDMKQRRQNAKFSLRLLSLRPAGQGIPQPEEK